MNNRIVCNKCGRKNLDEYRMALMMGKQGYRRYSVCLTCAKKLGLGEPTTGGSQVAKAKAVAEAQ